MSGSAVPSGVSAEAVAAARGYLRLGHEDEGALLARLAGAAILLGEAFCGMALVARPFEDVLHIGGGWQRLGAAPVGAIQGVTGLPTAGAPFVLPVEAYAVDIDAEGIGWVRVSAPDGAAGAATRVAVSYTAGVSASFAALPAPLAQGVTMLIAHLFGNRDAAAALPAAVAALWRPFRRLRLQMERHA